jgi:hypothetical protein
MAMQNIVSKRMWKHVKYTTTRSMLPAYATFALAGKARATM